jgi:hypothetical protein
VAYTAPPKQRLICHCTICQSVYLAAFADVTIQRANSVSLLTPDEVEFKRHKGPPSLNRGVCKTCNDPVIAWFDLPLMPRLAFIPTQSFPDGVISVSPSCQVYYDRRVEEGPDVTPKASGTLSSLMTSMGPILRAASG